MKLVRYFFVGGVAACVDIGIFVLFARVLGWNYLAVAAVGFCLATLVNYLLSVRLVFKSGTRFGRRSEVGLIYLISGIGLGVNQTVLYVGIDRLGWDMVLCKLLATLIVFFWNYWARAHFVFSNSSTAKAS